MPTSYPSPHPPASSFPFVPPLFFLSGLCFWLRCEFLTRKHCFCAFSVRSRPRLRAVTALRSPVLLFSIALCRQVAFLITVPSFPPHLFVSLSFSLRVCVSAFLFVFGCVYSSHVSPLLGSSCLLSRTSACARPTSTLVSAPLSYPSSTVFCVCVRARPLSLSLSLCFRVCWSARVSGAASALLKALLVSNFFVVYSKTSPLFACLPVTSSLFPTLCCVRRPDPLPRFFLAFSSVCCVAEHLPPFLCQLLSFFLFLVSSSCSPFRLLGCHQTRLQVPHHECTRRSAFLRASMVVLLVHSPSRHVLYGPVVSRVTLVCRPQRTVATRQITAVVSWRKPISGTPTHYHHPLKPTHRRHVRRHHHRSHSDPWLTCW